MQFHTNSPYTLAVAIPVNEFQHIIEEAKIIVGNPVIIPNKPSGSIELANTVLNAKVRERRKKMEMNK
jgi:L-fuculose-phosphate aldolase